MMCTEKYVLVKNILKWAKHGFATTSKYKYKVLVAAVSKEGQVDMKGTIT